MTTDTDPASKNESAKATNHLTHPTGTLFVVSAVMAVSSAISGDGHGANFVFAMAVGIYIANLIWAIHPSNRN